jgi:hypothetical protein
MGWMSAPAIAAALLPPLGYPAVLRTIRTASATPPVHGSPCPGSTQLASTPSNRASEATAWVASAVNGATIGPVAPFVTATVAIASPMNRVSRPGT